MSAMRTVQQQPATPDYGIDAPPVVLTFVLLAFFSVMAGIFIGAGVGHGVVVLPFAVVSATFAAVAGYLVFSSKLGKARLWDEVLEGVSLDGTERALDLGCGRGLVLVKLAKHLDAHRVAGVDVWRAKDQSGNARVVTEANATVEGVADRIEVHDADMRSLPFADASFDLITASLAIHNIPDRAGRDTALAELARVLRPGGRAVIVDIAKTAEYQRCLEASGFLDIERSGRRLLTFPPSRVVTGRKPGS